MRNRIRARFSPRRALLVGALAAGLLATGVPPAQGDVWTGSCVLEVTFSFGTRIKSASLALTAPSYSISVSPAADLDPTTTAEEPCAVSLDALDPFRTTSVGGSGSSALWTCETTVGHGSWNQSWNPGPTAVFGAHAIAGTWGDWTMELDSVPNFAGVMHLTVHPSDASKLSKCATTGILSLRMLGVMAFQDPEIPG